MLYWLMAKSDKLYFLIETLMLILKRFMIKKFLLNWQMLSYHIGFTYKKKSHGKKIVRMYRIMYRKNHGKC